jgi:hypothetical protein
MNTHQSLRSQVPFGFLPMVRFQTLSVPPREGEPEVATSLVTPKETRTDRSNGCARVGTWGKSAEGGRTGIKEGGRVENGVERGIFSFARHGMNNRAMKGKEDSSQQVVAETPAEAVG